MSLVTEGYKVWLTKTFGGLGPVTTMASSSCVMKLIKPAVYIHMHISSTRLLEMRWIMTAFTSRVNNMPTYDDALLCSESSDGRSV